MSRRCDAEQVAKLHGGGRLCGRLVEGCGCGWPSASSVFLDETRTWTFDGLRFLAFHRVQLLKLLRAVVTFGQAGSRKLSHSLV